MKKRNVYRLVYDPYIVYRPIKLGPFLIGIPHKVKEYVLYKNNKPITSLCPGKEVKHVQ